MILGAHSYRRNSWNVAVSLFPLLCSWSYVMTGDLLRLVGKIFSWISQETWKYTSFPGIQGSILLSISKEFKSFPCLSSLIILVLPWQCYFWISKYIPFPAITFSDFPLLLVGAFATRVSHMTMPGCLYNAKLPIPHTHQPPHPSLLSPQILNLSSPV